MQTPRQIDRLPERANDGQRTFKDDCGRRWIVYERTSWTLANPARLFLIFEAVDAVRRVSIFPGAWRALDAIALERLSWAR
jgi:hypothetical protein